MGVNTTIFGSFRLPLAFRGPPSRYTKDAIKEHLCLARVTAPGHCYVVPFIVLPALSTDQHLIAIHHDMGTMDVEVQVRVFLVLTVHVYMFVKVQTGQGTTAGPL